MKINDFNCLAYIAVTDLHSKDFDDVLYPPPPPGQISGNFVRIIGWRPPPSLGLAPPPRLRNPESAPAFSLRETEFHPNSWIAPCF